MEARILRLHRERKLGPHRLAALVGAPRSTCYAVLRRHQLHRLDWMDRPSAEVIRRYERDRPGELIHVDIKKLARIPQGGGHRVLGRGKDGHVGHSGAGYEFIHAAVDDHSRLAYAEIHADEQATTTAAFLTQALAFFAAQGAPVERVITDNGSGYRSHLVRGSLAAAGVRHSFCRPYRPQTRITEVVMRRRHRTTGQVVGSAWARSGHCCGRSRTASSLRSPRAARCRRQQHRSSTSPPGSPATTSTCGTCATTRWRCEHGIDSD